MRVEHFTMFHPTVTFPLNVVDELPELRMQGMLVTVLFILEIFVNLLLLLRSCVSGCSEVTAFHFAAVTNGFAVHGF